MLPCEIVNGISSPSGSPSRPAILSLAATSPAAVAGLPYGSFTTKLITGLVISLTSTVKLQSPLPTVVSAVDSPDLITRIARLLSISGISAWSFPVPPVAGTFSVTVWLGALWVKVTSCFSLSVPPWSVK